MEAGGESNSPEANKPHRAALPAFGGPLPRVKITQPLSTLARLQELFPCSCLFVTVEGLSVDNCKIADDLAAFGVLSFMFRNPPFKVIGNSNISFTVNVTSQNVDNNHY